jgi:hypothetical protein
MREFVATREFWFHLFAALCLGSKATMQLQAQDILRSMSVTLHAAMYQTTNIRNTTNTIYVLQSSFPNDLPL